MWHAIISVASGTSAKDALQQFISGSSKHINRMKDSEIAINEYFLNGEQLLSSLDGPAVFLPGAAQPPP